MRKREPSWPWPCVESNRNRMGVAENGRILGRPRLRFRLRPSLHARDLVRVDERDPREDLMANRDAIPAIFHGPVAGGTALCFRPVMKENVN